LETDWIVNGMLSVTDFVDMAVYRGERDAEMRRVSP
jgi:hypothetical protein